VSTLQLSRRLSKGNKIEILGFLGIILIIIAACSIALVTLPHYDGEYYEHNSDNNMYYVYVHDADNESARYRIETPSQIFAKQISEIRDSRLTIKDDMYVVYNGEHLPCEFIGSN